VVLKAAHQDTSEFAQLLECRHVSLLRAPGILGETNKLVNKQQFRLERRASLVLELLRDAVLVVALASQGVKHGLPVCHHNCFVTLVTKALRLEQMGNRFSVHLTPAAESKLKSYFKRNPSARRFEERRSGMPSVTRDLRAFFKHEMTEPEHRDVREAVRRNRGLVTVSIVRQWIAENRVELSSEWAY